MPPTQQRFQADHPFFRNIDQRLVINLKSALNIGGPQERFHVAAGLGAFIHLRFEESISAAPFGWSASNCMIANSSPPRRATRSLSRTLSINRLATHFSKPSPVEWPSVSLMLLKPSRSTNSTATSA